ncbi:MAG: MBL fold metallo-hydrolase [Candidatus Heteroscillospira sp.]|jgi:phosphoribosyl 1,2-cyclic phosphodiesterase
MRFTSFASGSTGNCGLLSDGNTHILVDAGISMRRITKCLSQLGLNERDVAGVLITHEHKDHTAALNTMMKRGVMTVYAPRTVANHLRWTVPDMDGHLNIIPVGEAFMLGTVSVTAFHTSHDTDESVGFRFSGSAEFGYCTDTGCVTREMLDCLMGADAAVIEANHDVELLRYGSYPYFLKKRVLSERGHLSNEDCAELAGLLCQSGARGLILAHLSRENNRPELALQAVETHLRERGYEPFLQAAPMDGFCGIELEGSVARCWPLKSSAAAG